MHDPLHPDLARLRRRIWLAKSADEFLGWGLQWAIRLGKFFTALFFCWYILCSTLALPQMGRHYQAASARAANMFVLRTSTDDHQTKPPVLKRAPKPYVSPYK